MGCMCVPIHVFQFPSSKYTRRVLVGAKATVEYIFPMCSAVGLNPEHMAGKRAFCHIVTISLFQFTVLKLSKNK